ncbi:MAG: PPOX class F420-dependent oxidoreductase [Ktedonobacteraceae bacterium]|nr:PPOX class F420-dependent oxidoreductase [Ktedonobacteraceae bacterium]
MFSAQERAFLQEQPLARLATVAKNGQPDVDAVGFAFDGTHFYIGGFSLETSRKYLNVVAGQRLVSLIIDDLKTLDPYEPRGLKLHGEASIVTRDGHLGPGRYLAILPKVSWSWGIDGPVFQEGKFAPKKLVWK